MVHIQHLFSRSNLRNALTIASITLLLSSHTAYAQTKAPASCPGGLEVSDVTQTTPIKLTSRQSQTMLAVLETLSKNHYARLSINDELSKAWLENFLDNLDPSKSYFLADDIANYETQYSLKLDDFAKQGNLEPAKLIYQDFRRHAIQRLEQNIKWLNDDTYEFSFNTPETFIIDRSEHSWLANKKDADIYWHKLLTLSLLNFKLSADNDDVSANYREKLAQRYQNQLSAIRQQSAKEVVEYYLNSLTTMYDPHTSYLSPRESENFDITMKLSLEGIGAVLQKEDEFTKVVSVVAGGPASKQSQLSAGDKIIAVGEGLDCEFIDIIGWRLDEVVDRIRGPKSSTVRLKVIPADAGDVNGETLLMSIVRDEVKLEDKAAKGEIIEISQDKEGLAPATFGVIDLPSFYLDHDAMRRGEPDYRSTTSDVKRLLEEFTEKNVDGVIMDLRANGGGSLFESAQLTDLFIDQGPVVQIRDKYGRVSRRYYRSRNKAHYSGPLIVIIDRQSASASEIFAGAIQDYGRGLVVGSRSFGKGTVQGLKPLPEGEIKLTESKFYRVSGDSTQHLGVVPDISFPSFIDEEDFGESSYDYALKWDQIRGIPHVMYDDFKSLIPSLAKQHQQRLEQDEDLLYLRSLIALSKEKQQQKEISLNQETRTKQREYWDLREEQALQQWRQSKGITVPSESEQQTSATDSKTDASDTASNDDVYDADQDNDPTKPNIEDTLLYEAARVLKDYLEQQAATPKQDIAKK